MRQLLERFFPTLRSKIAVAVFFVLLAGGGAFVYFAHRTGYTMLQQQTQLKAQSISRVLSDVFEHAMLEGGKEHVKKALLSVTKSPDVVNVYLLKSDGAVSIRAKDGDTLMSLPVHRFQEVRGNEGDNYLSLSENEKLFEYVILPVMNKPECSRCHENSEPLRGYFAVKLTMDDVRSLAVDHRTTNLLMTFITFISLGVIIYFALSLLIIRPVQTLHSHIKLVEQDVKQLESGERTMFPLLAEPTSNDEIADLTRDVNDLIRRLNEANTKLIESHHLQLEQAARLANVGEMAASMAHEIKNPIAGVLGAVQVFDSELPADDTRKEIFSEMKVQLERVNHAVTDLLSFARPTLPMFEQVRINDVIQRTYSMLSKQIKENKIDVHLNLSEDANLISADKKQIQQVLWNVILNAVQAMENSGMLTISTVREMETIVCTIADTGKGISNECMNQVFKPFFTTKHKGTGLGMTITKRIVEQHQGTIQLQSEVGQGTTVRILLPLQHRSV